MPASPRDSDTVAALLEDATEGISESRSIDHWLPSMARYDAEELMAAVLGTTLTARARRAALTPAQLRRYRTMVARRMAGQPVAQIVGSIRFRGLELRLRRGVFGPRSSSEFLAAEAIAVLRRRRGDRLAVDVATGSGPVALAVAHEVPGAEVWGVDISAPAIRLGRDNARRLRISNAHFRVSDMVDALPSRMRGAVDVFTIHPPYVARREIRTLPREIRDFEPLHSLTDGSDDGLGLVRRLAAESGEWLRPGGVLLVEVGTYLSRSAQAVLRRAGLVDVAWKKDSLGVTRVVSGRQPRSRA
ncbi:MAG TPA: peptide chain release factor N(5)-glutamine methyltransferase [Candidatus Dormibacteraeota bacterium]